MGWRKGEQTPLKYRLSEILLKLYKSCHMALIDFAFPFFDLFILQILGQLPLLYLQVSIDLRILSVLLISRNFYEILP